MSVVIKAENLSKAYQLGEFSTGTLSRDIERWWAKMRGKEDPFLKIGETNDRTRIGKSDIVWSLKDINFEIQQGDAIGIIGKNGAGKSTLLKLLSRVTSPTTGSIKIKGRVASLLEVGTGFHPELTGRENIFLNGTILGMRKAEIKKHFDAIVDFSGVERYVDTPVKRYSSGMYVRLAFAVAAHLESEILIVDEVLAVGDAEFQKKCLGKMGEVSKGEGRTVLFVSHNIGAVRQLCTSGILLRKGELVAFEQLDAVVAKYSKDTSYSTQINESKFTGPLTEQVIFKKIFINEKDVDAVDVTISPSQEISIKVITALKKNLLLRIGLSIYKDGVRLLTMHDVKQPELVSKEVIESDFIIHQYFLRPGLYSISLGAYEGTTNGDWTWGTELTTFEILEEWNESFESRSFGIVNVNGRSNRS
jgi:lipopolysaccharide transport system ATP-binding protein